MQPTAPLRPWPSSLAFVQCPAWLPGTGSHATPDPDPASCPAGLTAWERADFAPLPRPDPARWFTRAWHWLRGEAPTEGRVEASQALRQRAQDGGARLLATGESVHASIRHYAASHEASQARELPAWAKRMAEGKGEVLLADSHEYASLVAQAVGESKLGARRATVLPQRDAVLVDAGRFPLASTDRDSGFAALGDLLHAWPDPGDAPGVLYSVFKREALDDLRRTLAQATQGDDADALIEAAADLAANDPPRLPLARDLHRLLGDSARGTTLAALMDGQQPAIRHLVTAGLVLRANESARRLLAPTLGDFDLLQHGLQLEMEAVPALLPGIQWTPDPASRLPARVAAHRYLRPKDRVENSQGFAPVAEHCRLRVTLSPEYLPREENFLVTMLKAYQGSFRSHVIDTVARALPTGGSLVGSELHASRAAVSYLLQKAGRALHAGRASAADALRLVIATRSASDGVHYEEAERRVLSILYDARRTGTAQDIAELAQLQLALHQARQEKQERRAATGDTSQEDLRVREATDAEKREVERLKELVRLF